MDKINKVCSSCGSELPLKYFTSWTNKDGTIGYLHECKTCQRNKANHRHAEKKKFGEITKFTDDIIIRELQRRGTSFLEYVDIETLAKEIKSRGYMVMKMTEIKT